MDTFCSCPNPVSGPGTLTDYTGLPTLYRLCFTCGLPIALSGEPAPEFWFVVDEHKVQRTRYSMRMTVR